TPILDVRRQRLLSPAVADVHRPLQYRDRHEVRGLLEARLVAVDQRKRAAARAEVLCERAADTRRRSGHDRYTAIDLGACHPRQPIGSWRDRAPATSAL